MLHGDYSNLPEGWGEPTQPILDPTRPAAPSSSADQFAAELADRILAGLSAGLAASMTKRTMETGPWLLMGDGRVFRVDMPDPPYTDVVDVLTDHVSDWGRCSHPADCQCSDARARRLLAAHPLVFGEWLEPITSGHDVPVHVLAELMDACSDSEGQWNGGDVCQDLAAIIRDRGGWKSCDVHGLVYSATKSACPRCVTELTDDDLFDPADAATDPDPADQETDTDG